MVRGKIRMVNHGKNVEIRSRRNQEEGPTRRYKQNLQIVGKRSLNITLFGGILRSDNHDGCTNVKLIDKPQGQIIATSNKSTNLKD